MPTSTLFCASNSGIQVGDNGGHITVQHYARPESQESPPLPSSTVPFGRDPDFVEQGQLLEQTHEKCSITGSRVALVGLGGVGIRERSPSTWVLWVHASNAARFEESFWQIADRAKLPERQDPNLSIFKVVHDWLADAKQKWVMILDNVDDDQFLYEPCTRSRMSKDDSQGSSLKVPLLTFIPECPNGSVIWKTRFRRVATRAVNLRNILSVEPMDTSHAVTLPRKKLTSTPNEQDIKKLTEALDFMPLAIVQAAAYIACRAPRCSVLEYLEEFEKNDQRTTMLLNHEAGQSRRD
ncbi:hypothetical protein PEX1_088330 [Penicillium expansum]|nr:hypothetical protein PEX1_088330 [Penicillium expansum]